MRRRILVAVGSGLIGGVLVAADAGRHPGYIVAYYAAAALLALVIAVLTALVLCIPTRSRPAGVFAAFAGIAFYGAFVLSMTTLEREGAWDERPFDIGPPTQGGLTVLFKPGTDQKLVNQFVDNELTVPDGDGGRRHRPGISKLLLIHVRNQAGYSVSFRRSATSEQRAEIWRRAERSEVVAKVVEYVRLDQVRP
jgi:hypothetical protein